jgi:hypothetical protein
MIGSYQVPSSPHKILFTLTCHFLLLPWSNQTKPNPRSTNGRGEDRLCIQGGAHRRLRRGEIPDLVSVRSRRVQSRLQSHHWSRVSDSNSLDSKQEYKGSDLGYRWSGKVLPFFFLYNTFPLLLFLLIPVLDLLLDFQFLGSLDLC